MSRINIKDLTDRDRKFIKDGTAALCLTLNPHNNRYGVLKENGCMLGVENEDLREKLASTILNICGVKCADIDLCIDDNNTHYCISYNILKENQEHIELEYSGTLLKSENKEKIFNEYFKNIFVSVIVLPSITLKEYFSIKQRILELYLMNLIVGNYDDKSNNMKIIYDKKQKIYFPPIAYDYGVAFSENGIQKNGIFSKLTSTEVMYFLIKYYFNELKDLIERIHVNLTDEKLIDILSDEVYEPLGRMHIYNQIKYKIIMMNNTLESLQKDNLCSEVSKII